MNELQQAVCAPALAAEAGEPVTVERIKQAVRSHRMSTHTLFPRLIEHAQEGKLTGEQFRIVAANIAARTKFTLTEIFTACLDAALRGERTLIAYSALTAFDEAGSGSPEQVHPIMMMRSLNNHLDQVFNQPPIAIQPIIDAVWGKHLVSQLERCTTLENALPENLKPEMRAVGNTDHMLRRIRALAAGIAQQPAQNMKKADELAAYVRLFSAQIAAEKLTPETLAYCEQQLELRDNITPGYIFGVTYAHEEGGDNLFHGLYHVMSADKHRYRDSATFKSITYPYIHAHHDFEAADGGDSEAVEILHRKREEAKLAALSPGDLQPALIGAMDFLYRNAMVYDGIEREIFNPGGIKRFTATAPQSA